MYISHYKNQPGAHFRPMMLSLLKSALSSSSAGEIKDIVQHLQKMQEDRLREESAAKAAAATAAKKAPGKKTINVGKSGGSAGLDDYIYDDDAGGDDYGACVSGRWIAAGLRAIVCTFVLSK